MSENWNNYNDYNNHKNKNKNKIDYILYWFIAMIIINIWLLLYLNQPKPTPPTLKQQVQYLYDVNQDTYKQINEIKDIFNWKNQSTK